MIATKTYLALDLEMNQPSGKIIQVGIAIGTYDDYVQDCISTYSFYVNPDEPISEFITELTGITDETIEKNSVYHQYIADKIASIMSEHNIFMNPVTWGCGDTQALFKEFQDRNIEFESFGRRWIDVKTWYVFDRLAKGKSVSGGLKSAMTVLSKNKLQFKGDQHKADVDALNTLRLFFYMLDKQSKIESIIQDIKEL